MAGGPWEDYQSAAPAAPSSDDAAPWLDYQTPAPATLKDYGHAAWSAVQAGLSKLDSYTGAPVRAAIAEDQEHGWAGKPLTAFAQQFGQDPAKAPTGQDIARRAGVPDTALSQKLPGLYSDSGDGWALKRGGWLDPTASGAVGLGVDIGSNPTSYIPVGELVGGAAKVAGRATGLGARAAADAAPEATVAANAASKLPAAKPGALAKAAGVTAETFTGVDKHLATNYAANTDRVNEIISHYTGPEGYSEAAHATDIRDQWRSAIKNTRQQMNGKISRALESDAGQAPVSAQSVITGIDSAIAKANPATQAKDIATLQDLKATLGKMTNAEGQISLKNLHDFKQYAADAAAPAYDSAGNAIFPGGKFAASQAKGIAGTARQVLIDTAPKEVSQAEGVLAKLHNAEDTMNSTLLKDNGPVHAISRAGVNPGGIEARSLDQLGKITGYNFAQDAKDFATTRAFASPKFTPEFNGKSLLRAGVGAGAGYLASRVLPIPAEYAAMAGAAVSSPGALKAGLNVANLASKGAMLPVNAVRAAPQAAYGALTSPVGRRTVDLGAKALISQPVTLGAAQADRAPARGEAAWAQRGLERLGITDQAAAQRLMSDPKARELLMQASDLAPGSRALKNIQAQIQKGWGSK